MDAITAVAADPFCRLNWPDTASRLPYFTVRISPYGSVRVSGTSYYDLSDEQVLSGIVTAALRSGGEQGLLHDYSLRYLRTTWRGNEYIIFADVSSAKRHDAESLAKLYSLSGYAPRRYFSPSAFFWRAGRCKPVERAWTQQKQFVFDALARPSENAAFTVILTNAEMLRDPSYPGPERQRALPRASSPCRTRCAGWWKSLLELARVDNGAVKKSI